MHLKQMRKGEEEKKKQVLQTMFYLYFHFYIFKGNTTSLEKYNSFLFRLRLKKRNSNLGFIPQGLSPF
jgi:hypothetical protein